MKTALPQRIIINPKMQRMMISGVKLFSRPLRGIESNSDSFVVVRMDVESVGMRNVFFHNVTMYYE